MWNKLNNTVPKQLENPQLMTSLEFKNGLDRVAEISKDICHHCGGSGELNAMQSMAIIGGGSVRGPDTKVKCNQCKGRGIK